MYRGHRDVERTLGRARVSLLVCKKLPSRKQDGARPNNAAAGKLLIRLRSTWWRATAAGQFDGRAHADVAASNPN